MPINFIPNDPRAGSSAPALRTQPARPNRPATRSGFTFTGAVPEGVFAPGTPQFLFWQVREAALSALDAWEASAGLHKKWQGNRAKLSLLQDAGQDLNAFYNRSSLSFFHQTVGTTTFFSGASADVVAHETGHALLDSIRPDFWDINFLEVGAFHECFGDIIALLTALEDLETRKKLLTAAPSLRKRNFVESTAEDLSEGIRKLQPTHNAAEPRHAFNTFKFQIPSSLPTNGGPGALINEVHSFGMIFTGCFWDLIANLFAAAAVKNEAALLAAARLAGKILIAGVQTAVITPRFFQSVGRSMVLADQSLNAGANRASIKDAFLRHNILLGSDSVLAPSMALSGPAPKGNAKSGTALLGAATRKDLRQRLGDMPGARLSLAAEDVFGTRLVTATQTRDVSLGDVDPRLKGVVAIAHEPARVGDSGGRAAVVGVLPEVTDTEVEVQAFVASLLGNQQIDLKKPQGTALVADATGKSEVTHSVRSVGGKKVLRRVRFQCQCHRSAQALLAALCAEGG